MRWTQKQRIVDKWCIYKQNSNTLVRKRPVDRQIMLEKLQKLRYYVKKTEKVLQFGTTCDIMKYHENIMDICPGGTAPKNGSKSREQSGF